MLISLIQDAPTWFMGVAHWSDVVQTVHGHSMHVFSIDPIDLLAQASKTQGPLKVDLGGDVQRAFNNFVKTGQIWAFLIGLIVGYIFRSFTSYG